MDLRVRTRCVTPLALGIVLTVFALLPRISAQSTSGNSSQPWMNANLSPDERASLVLKQMTLDEKISLLHGTGMIGLSPIRARCSLRHCKIGRARWAMKRFCWSALKTAAGIRI